MQVNSGYLYCHKKYPIKQFIQDCHQGYNSYLDGGLSIDNIVTYLEP